PDGEGVFFIGGLFTQIGDSSRINIAHINSSGIPTSWKATANDAVKALVLINDTLVVGGRFSKISDSSRNGFAIINKQTGTTLVKTTTNSFLQAGTEINAMKLVDKILFVGTGSDVSNAFGTLFKVNTTNYTPSSVPTTFHMEDVFTLEASADNKKLYIGGRAGGGPATSNGFCMNIATNALLYRINAGVLNHSGRAAIYHIKVHGATVFAGGLFNTGNVNGNNFSQKGIVAFDTASGQLRNYLTNCDGLVSSIHASGNQLYISGEFTSIAGNSKFNFAVFDTTSKTTINNTLNISDQITTISFHGNQMFAGGFFHSIGCVPRKNFAAVNMYTGEIKSWYPSISPLSSVADMKALGDTVLIAGKLYNPSSQGIGVFAAVNATSGTVLPGSPVIYLNSADKILIEGQTAYLALNTGGVGQGFVGKLSLPSLSFSASGYNYLGFNIKSIQKKNNSIYCIGDLYGNNIRKGFIAEVNEATGKAIRTTELSLNGQVDWLTAGVLVNNKFFFCGLFSKILGENRSSFAVFDI
ncbi:MAG TPA: hypothetical protein VK173_11405, partial [Lacibacter sp.]|nr:hypothetical protein [Lacibacter sp.]